MDKYAACIFLAATCLSGCGHVAQKTGDAHFDSYLQCATGTFQEPPTEEATHCTLDVDPAKSEFATARNPVTEQASTHANQKKEQREPVESETSKESRTVVAEVESADDTARDPQRHAAIGQVPETVESHSPLVVPMQQASSTEEKQVEDKANNVHQAGWTPNPEQGSQHSFSREVWYCIASIWGAMFTYILSPLALDFIRQRMGLDSKKTAQLPADGDGGYGDDKAQMQAVRVVDKLTNSPKNQETGAKIAVVELDAGPSRKQRGPCVVSADQIHYTKSDEEVYTLRLGELCQTVVQSRKGHHHLDASLGPVPRPLVVERQPGKVRHGRE